MLKVTKKAISVLHRKYPLIRQSRKQSKKVSVSFCMCISNIVPWFITRWQHPSHPNHGVHYYGFHHLVGDISLFIAFVMGPDQCYLKVCPSPGIIHKTISLMFFFLSTSITNYSKINIIFYYFFSRLFSLTTLTQKTQSHASASDVFCKYSGKSRNSLLWAISSLFTIF